MLFSANSYHREWLTEQFREACCGSPATVPSKELHSKSARADRYHHRADAGNATCFDLIMTSTGAEVRQERKKPLGMT
jgi:hypothetical protein